MNISIKIEYDNMDQYLDIKGLPKYLAKHIKHIKNKGKEKTYLYINIENHSPPIDHNKLDPLAISIPTVIISDTPKALKGKLII